MTVNEYRAYCDGLRMGRVQPGGYCRIEATPRPSRPAPARPAPVRRPGQSQRCAICETPIFASPRLNARCAKCEADAAWRVSLAKQGLKVRWN